MILLIAGTALALWAAATVPTLTMTVSLLALGALYLCKIRS